MRTNYKGKGFTENQVATWVGYLSMAVEGRGLKGKQHDIIMSQVEHALMFYGPYEKDVNNE